MAPLNADTLRRLRTAKIHKDSRAPINSLEFSANGETLVVASDDESLHVYNCGTGSHEKKLLSQRYGVDLVRLCGASGSSAVCASRNDWDQTIRHLSIHTNQFLRYFKGHRDRIVSMEMSPRSDAFVSGSRDETIRFWDLRASACQGVLRVPGATPTAAFDPEGLVVLATAGDTVRLYDSRQVDGGPFATFRSGSRVGSAVFTPDGNRVIIGSESEPVFRAIDAFDGSVKATYTGHAGFQGGGVQARPAVTPGGRFVVAGSADGRVIAWDAADGEIVHEWKAHVGPVRCVGFNPRLMLMGSACTNLALWIPRTPAEQMMFDDA